MAIKLTKHAVEKGTYGVEISFFDSAGNPVAPKTLTWSLTNVAGEIVNNLRDVAVVAPGETVTIVLTGDDLQILSAANRQEARKLILAATYDDAELGADCPLPGEIGFIVET